MQSSSLPCHFSASTSYSYCINIRTSGAVGRCGGYRFRLLHFFGQMYAILRFLTQKIFQRKRFALLFVFFPLLLIDTPHLGPIQDLSCCYLTSNFYKKKDCENIFLFHFRGFDRTTPGATPAHTKAFCWRKYLSTIATFLGFFPFSAGDTAFCTPVQQFHKALYNH